MMRRLVGSRIRKAIFWLAWLAPAVAFAQKAAAQTGAMSPIHDLVDMLFTIAGTAAVTALSGVATLLLHKALTRLHVNVSAAQEASWDTVIQNSILQATAWARNKIGTLDANTNLPGPAVLSQAVTWAIAAAQAAGLPAKAQAVLEGLIEAKLLVMQTTAAPNSVSADPTPMVPTLDRLHDLFRKKVAPAQVPLPLPPPPPGPASSTR